MHGRLRRCRSVAGAGVLALALTAQSQGVGALDDPPAQFRELARDNMHGFLNDLSVRRRTTTMFPNPQSVFAGVQENFVNTSTGALTFLVRDLVRVGGMPIVMGRVYDSTLADGGDDFGPGWKLTVVEELRQEGARMLFTDASNAVHALDVDGDAVVPASPATAPVVSGSIRAGDGDAETVVLESADGMRRRFERDGDVWRLVQVRHAGGWVGFGWRAGVLNHVTSDRGWVRIARRGDGRVVSILDDAGRTVGYSYDAEGRLTGVNDLGGGSWHLTYAGDRLASVTDPRTKVVLAVSWTDDRVRRIRVLHRTTDFRYSGSATTATNLLGWSTVYRFRDSGITESITDRTGTTTAVAFDADHRPTAVARDGSVVARIGYDDAGAPATLWRPQGAIAFAYADGDIAAVAGASTARYRYADGRVVHASDALGRRDYRYAEDGSLAGATIDGVDTELRTGTDGTIAQVGRGGRPLASYGYAPDGRVTSIDYGDGRTATFVYDARGLRTGAEYAYGDVRIAATMAYDAVGNLVRHAVGEADGEATEQTYLVGDYNEVLRVRTGDGRDPSRPDLTFSYDADGRLLGAGAGGRSATVEYDALDRVTRMVVDGETQFEAAYGAEETDAAARADRRTGGVLVAWPVSPVFGTMESVVYARPRSAEFGIVAYSPSLKTYRVRPEALAPDALLLASLRARLVPLGADGPDPAPFGHDKPSNSLFVPPELMSVNCQLCTGAVFDVYLTVTPAPVHCATKYSASVDGYCHTVVSGDHAPISFGVALPWLHTTRFGDGTSTFQSNTRGAVDGTHAYHRAKTYTMSHSVLCTCASVFASGTATRTFTVSQVGACPAPRCSFDFGIEPGSPAISAAPAMPSITARASNLDPPSATISWTAAISYDAGSGCWGGPVFSAEADGTGKSFSPYFGYGTYGGELTITARCSATGYESRTIRQTVTVKGTQPTDAAIIAQIGTVGSPFDGADLRRIACHESSLTQFQSGTGMPYRGATDDIGIMQICWDRRIEHLWNWRSNVNNGKSILTTSKRSAKNHLDEEEKKSGATPYTTQMWRREAIHRYNAGTGSGNEYWVWIPPADDTPGRWDPVARGGAAGYAAAVLNQSASCR